MVTGNNSEATYFGDGAAVDFSTSFYFLAASEVIVTQTVAATGVTTTLVNGVHYTLTMPAASGLNGTVHMVTAPAVDDTLYIYRQVPFTQEVDLRTSGQFDAEVHEQVMDRLTHQSQQLHRRLAVVEAQGTAGSVVAGDGLSYSGATLNVGAGAGISTDASNVSVLFGGVGPGTPQPLDITFGTTAGVADTAARVDHTHALPMAETVPPDIVSSGATEGGSVPTIAFSDHTHNHGNLAGGSQHAVATTSVAGFMSAADKTDLDAFIAAGVPVFGEWTTTSNTTETSTYATIPVSTTLFTQIDLTAGVVGSEGSLAGAWRLIHMVTRSSGGAMTHVIVDVSEFVNTGGFTAPTASVSGGGTAVVRVTGTLATTIKWHWKAVTWEMSH